MTRSVIAIGGPHGSGKSSVAEKLAEELNMNYLSAGVIFRQLAKERGYSLEDFSELVLNEPDIDREIDERTKELGKQNNTIVDAQLAAHFTPSDVAIKISITANPETRWKRIAKRENWTLEEAKQETLTREKSEQDRFLKLYNIDVLDNTYYDVVINNDRLSEEQTYYLCKVIVEHALKEM